MALRGELRHADRCSRIRPHPHRSSSESAFMRRRTYAAGRSTTRFRPAFAIRSIARGAALAAALILGATQHQAAAQVPGHSPGAWRTMETEHFTIHYPV